MAQAATYFSHGLLTGSPSTVDEFRQELKRYSRDQMVYLCSAINVLLRDWFGGTSDFTIHDALLTTVLGATKAQEFINARKRYEHHYVFHREQLLFIAKEAILQCPEIGVNPLEQTQGVLTSLFLMANDHLYTPQTETTDFEQNLLNVLVNVIPSIEYSAPRIFRNTIARSHLMYGRFAGELKEDDQYIDTAARFSRLTGLTPDEFMAACFGLLTKYTRVNIKSFAADPTCLFVKDDYFQQTAMTVDNIRKFMKEISATPAEYRNLFAKKLVGTSDFTLFRSRPLYVNDKQLFCIDSGFLTEKMETAPFWRTLFSISVKEDRDNFVAFWGRIFERYMNWLLTESVSSDCKYNQFIPSPKYVSDGSEVCDGLMVCGSDAIFMEYKGAVFTAGAKYGGDPNKLRTEIEEKLIRNQKGERKGIEQLAEAIRRTCQRQEPEGIEGVDLSGVRRVFPLLILRDSIGDVPLMNAFLKHRFEATPDLSSKTVRPKILTPLFCIAADTMEYLSAYLHGARFSDILDARYRGNKGMGNPFLTVDNPVLTAVGEKGSIPLGEAFHKFMEPVVKTLFPDEAAKVTRTE
jgi:hypothetical protein